MYSKIILLICCLAGFFRLVSACEGECIIEITKAFLGNYSVPIHTAFREMSQEISTDLLPPSQRPIDPMTFIQPILTAYSKISYDTLEDAIFPSYFHGKCQRFSKDGQDPPGCPNPDCPVVCGTPGSMVHFYSTLRYIVFNSTSAMLEKLATPGNDAYDQVNTLVQRAQGVHKRDLVATHGMGHSLGYRNHSKRVLSRILRSNLEKPGLQSRSTSNLVSIMSQFSNHFIRACGGNARDSEDALPKCSWEQDMKKFILSFP
ncbi:hypothetical protein ACEPAI_9745 [Sanghuangporus weigelae]